MQSLATRLSPHRDIQRRILDNIRPRPLDTLHTRLLLVTQCILRNSLRRGANNPGQVILSSK